MEKNSKISEIKLDLSGYATESLLDTYAFIFSQWIGGSTTRPTIKQFNATVYIFGEILAEIRCVYLSRPDAKIYKIIVCEKEMIEKVKDVLNISESDLRIIYEGLLIQQEAKLLQYRKNIN